MSLRVYKSIKGLVLLAAAGVAFVAINNGADPLTVWTLLVAVLIGPEALEAHLAGNGTDSETTQSNDNN